VRLAHERGLPVYHRVEEIPAVGMVGGTQAS
jgi:hypothetical protein